MAAPSIRVELIVSPISSFFDYFTLDDDDSVLDGDVLLGDEGTVYDFTSDVRWLDCDRGRQRDLDEFLPGRLVLELNNRNRTYDPLNTESILAGNIEPMREVRVTATSGGVEERLFTGFVQQWTVDYSNESLPLASMQAADCLAFFSGQDLDAISADHSGDLSGARVERVLDLPEVAFSADLRSVEAGDTVFGPTTFGQNAGVYLQLCATSEGGTVYVRRDGVFRFEQRSSAPGGNVLTFSDDGDAAHVRYQVIDQSMSADLVYNRILTSGTTGSVQEASDQTSIDSYRVRQLDRRGQLALDDEDMAGQGQFLLGRFKAPEVRLRQVEVNVAALAIARQQDLLALELTDRVTVERTPPGGGAPGTISQPALVDGIRWFVGRGGTDFRAVVTMSTGRAVVGLVLDDDDFGVLDENLLIY